MKHLYWLLIFILLSKTAHSQNWQAVYSDRLTYFDSSRQAIKIVYKAVNIDGDSVLKNYPSHFMDSLGRTNYFYGRILDSTSWIGRKIIIKPDGYNGFVNDSNWFFWLNTHANVNDTFTFFENNRVHIRAHCSTILWADTFGIKDSIKSFKFTYTLKPGYSPYVDTSKWKKHEIWLSKHYGLLKVFPFNQIIISKSELWFTDKIYNYSAKNYFTNRNFNTLEVGDEFEYNTSNNYDRNHYYENKYYYLVVKKSTVPGTDTIKYDFLVKHQLLDRYKKWHSPYGPDDWHWENDIKHFVTKETKPLLVNDEPIFGWLPNQLVKERGGLFRKVFLMNDTCNLVVDDVFYGEIRDTIKNIFQPPFESAGGMDYHSGIGFLYWFSDGSTGTFNPVGQTYSITYRNFCNSIVGTPWAKYYVWPYSVNELEKETISLYPNPASQSITVQGEGIKSAEVYDLSARKLEVITTHDNIGNLVIDVATLAPGIYIIHVTNSQGISAHKVMVSR